MSILSIYSTLLSELSASVGYLGKMTAQASSSILDAILGDDSQSCKVVKVLVKSGMAICGATIVEVGRASTCF